MGTALGLLGIGWYVALCLLGGAFGGIWLDSRFGTGPLFVLLGIGAGLAIAGFGMYRMLQAVLSQGRGPGA
jgi:hypothetical protein